MPRSLKKGPFVDKYLHEEDRGRREGDQPEQARHHDLLAPLDGHPRHGRSDVRRPQRPQVHPGVHHRADGRPQARRVLARPARSTVTPASGRSRAMQARALRSWHLDVAPQDAGRRQPRPRQDGRGGRRPARPHAEEGRRHHLQGDQERRGERRGQVGWRRVGRGPPHPHDRRRRRHRSPSAGCRARWAAPTASITARSHLTVVVTDEK